MKSVQQWRDSTTDEERSILRQSGPARFGRALNVNGLKPNKIWKLSVEISSTFAWNEEVALLGMKLSCAPEKSEEKFPEEFWRKSVIARPRIFVHDPGPWNNWIRTGDLKAGDAIWLVGGDPARYRVQWIDSIATLINSLAVTHNPYCATRICWLVGSNPTRGPARKGWTRCSRIHLSEREADELVRIRKELKRHPRYKEVGKPLKFYCGGPYDRYTNRCSADPMDPEGCIVTDMPVHQQFLFVLQEVISQRRPCEIILRQIGKKVVVEEIDVAIDPPLSQVMGVHQVGSVEHLFKHIDDQTKRFGTSHYFNRTQLRFRKMAGNVWRISAE